MVQTVLGKKGSGKTKRLIDLANEALKSETGSIVFIDDDTRYMYDLRHEIRFVNAAEYGIEGADALYGLLCGMLAVNFDTTKVFIDPFLHLLKGDMGQAESMIDRLHHLSRIGKCDFVVAASGDEDAMPDFLTRLAI